MDRTRPPARQLLALVLLASLVVGACGEGGGDSETAGLTPQVAAATPRLPASEVENTIASTPMTREAAFRLLDQATFGATLDEIDAVAASGPEPWIDAQMQRPANLLLPTLLERDASRWNEYVNVWWQTVVRADDQLRQRVAFALSEFFVVSAADGLGAEQPGLANYYDLLLRHAFGNYRDLLQAVTLSPVMGDYLSMKGNRKPDPSENIRPDENYAREVLQLFSIGTVMLNPDGSVRHDAAGRAIPTYDQDVVEGFAHVFTGWHFANADDFRWPRQKDFLNPMVAWPEYHDTGPKRLLDGAVLPAGQTAEDDLADALDNIFAHPNVGPTIARHLIQRLVTSNPSPEYIADVAAVFDRNSAGERGSLASTVKAVLMHREAREGHEGDALRFGKPREPLLQVTRLWRAFGGNPDRTGFTYTWVDNDISQAPLAAPSVFNFFRPEQTQAGPIADAGLVAPEFGLLDDTSVVSITGRLLANSVWAHNHRDRNEPEKVVIDIDREIAMADDPDSLLDHLDLLLLGGRMTPALREEARHMMRERARAGAAQQVVEAIFMIAASAEAAIQR